jgi:hypothetical protein
MKTETAIEPKDGDVFRFGYNQAEYDQARGDLNWCFDGQLVYRGGRFIDTYWGLERSGVDGRTFTLAEAQAKGVLRFVCNLSEVEKIRPEEYELYADGDAFNLSHQHGCYKHYVKRKGAKKDPQRMTAALYRKVQDARNEIDRAVRNLEWAVSHRDRLLPRIENGEEPCI